MPIDSDDCFHVFRAGCLTIIGFTAVDALSPAHVDNCRKRLQQLVEDHACQELVVDLYDMPIISSWILGLLAYIQTRGLRVHLYHPSPAIRDILKVTHLDRLMDIRGEVSLPE